MKVHMVIAVHGMPSSLTGRVKLGLVVLIKGREAA